MHNSVFNEDVDATNVTDYIIEYEDDNLDGAHTIKLFQYLLDSGLVWKLQGSYQRVMKCLLDDGYLVRR